MFYTGTSGILHGRLDWPQPESMADHSKVRHRHADVADRRELGVVITGLLREHLGRANLGKAHAAAEYQDDYPMKTIVVRSL